MTRTVLAADIGATSMRAALVSERGEVTHREVTPTLPERDFEDATARFAAMLEDVLGTAPARPEALGIATAGPVDPRTGTYGHSPNLPHWRHQSMVSLLSQRLGLPVLVGHDATLAALGETRFGAHAGARHLVYLTVSTGVGAGIIADGRMITGAGGGAGEAGHLIVEPGGPRCGAGCPGCLEAVASGTGIAAEARRRIEAGERTSLPPHPTAIDVAAAARDGDALAVVVIDRALGHLASGIAGLLALLDPEALIIGGGVIEGLAERWDDLMALTAARALPRYHEHLPVERTALGDDVGLLGAGALALDHLDGHLDGIARAP